MKSKIDLVSTIIGLFAGIATTLTGGKLINQIWLEKSNLDINIQSIDLVSPDIVYKKFNIILTKLEEEHYPAFLTKIF